MKKTPLQRVRETFGSKDELVAAVAKLVEPRAGEDAAGLSARLRRVSNAKLLHLHAVGTKVQALGGKDALVKKIAELKGQPKDLPYLDALGRKSLGALLDLHASLSRKAARAK